MSFISLETKKTLAVIDCGNGYFHYQLILIKRLLTSKIYKNASNLTITNFITNNASI